MSYLINRTGEDSYLADSTSGIGRGLRVKLVNGRRITPAAAAELEVGTTETDAIDNKTPVRVRLRNAPGTVEVQVNGAFDYGTVLKRDAAGKVGAAGAGSDHSTADSAGTDELGAVLPL